MEGVETSHFAPFAFLGWLTPKTIPVMEGVETVSWGRTAPWL